MSEARQIQSMIDFIEREAQEKAEELDSAAQEEYDVEKMRLVETEKTRIRANLDKKKKQVDVDRRVANANFSKAQRLRVMEERAKIMEALHEQTKKKIEVMVANTSVYQKMLTGLMQQSILALQTDAVVQCRKEDQSSISGMIKEVEQWYKEKSGSPVSIQISKDYLNSSEAWGGIVAVSTDGRIICNNTLSYRTKTCFEEQLPSVRYYLFNPEAKV